MPRRTLQQQIAEFKLTCRRVLSTLAAKEHVSLFQASPSKIPRFLSLQIFGHSPTIQGRVCISVVAAETLRVQLVRLLHRATAKSIGPLLSGDMCVPKRKLSIQKGVRCEVLIPTLQSCIFTYPPVTQGAPEASLALRPARTDASPFFQCPRCHHNIHAIHPAFHNPNMESRIVCKGCSLSICMYRFLCTCGSTWSTCDLHMSVPFRLRDRNPGLNRKLDEPNTGAACPQWPIRAH